MSEVGGPSGSGWTAPDRPGSGAPSYASDWPQVPGRPPLPAPPVRPPARPVPVSPSAGGPRPVSPPMRITLPPGVAPPPMPPRMPMPGPTPWTGPVRQPGGLRPTGPPRPIFREPGPVRLGPLAAGAGSGALWILLFGLLATTARGYAWLTFGSGVAAWLGALVLARFGDRGVAVGVALSTGVGVAIAGIVVLARWVGGQWLLW